MQHAGEQALDDLEDVLQSLRVATALKERARGVFYRRSAAFLHFHEDPQGLFADVRGPDGWIRLRVSRPDERAELLARVQLLLGA